MNRRLISYSLLLSVFSFLAGASTCSIPIKNIEFCRDKGKLGATCAYWLNARETKKRISITEWNAKRFGMTCTSEKGMGNINALIETLCQGRTCVEKTQELIKALE